MSRRKKESKQTVAKGTEAPVTGVEVSSDGSIAASIDGERVELTRLKAVRARTERSSSYGKGDADVIPITPVVGEHAEISPQSGAAAWSDHSIGWTPEITARLRWVLDGKSKEFAELALEIDRDVSYFVAGIVALALGDYDLAGLTLWNAGMLEKAPSAVEETEE